MRSVRCVANKVIGPFQDLKMLIRMMKTVRSEGCDSVAQDQGKETKLNVTI
jgi:hypothetical protein